MPNGTMTIANVGVAIMITMIVLRIPNRVKRNKRMDLGMVSSTT